MMNNNVIIQVEIHCDQTDFNLRSKMTNRRTIYPAAVFNDQVLKKRLKYESIEAHRGIDRF